MNLLRNRSFSLLIILVTYFVSCQAMSQAAKERDFVYLQDVAPTIQQSPRYYSDENFVGKRIDGYKKPVIMVTKKAAEALKKVQEDIEQDGYELVVYDGYRPQKAVSHFVRWSEDVQDQTKKKQYYPRIDKARVFELGYVAKRSGHSRGSTVDLTLIKKGSKIHAIQEEERTLTDEYVILYLNDGTVDMGSSFDLFDKASHSQSDVIEEKYQNLRNYLRIKMETNGFKHYSEEWWHFTLVNEPHPADQDSSYADCDIE